MAKARRVSRRRISARHVRARPYKFAAPKRSVGKSVFAKNFPNVMEKKEWEGAICPVCMECPHNAVLLLCSSHDKGCRPYMCGTSFRYANCLDQYKKASSKQTVANLSLMNNKSELTSLKCPLCRGQVKGWTIVQPARDDLNLKKRSCMQESCCFAGAFKELRKHMKMDHPCARPREVDPDEEQKWRRFEIEQDRGDVLSIIRSAMPGATFVGDYVIERGAYGSDSDEGGGDTGGEDDVNRISGGVGRNIVNVFLMLQAYGASIHNNNNNNNNNASLVSDANELAVSESDVESSEEEEEEDERMSLANQLRSRRRALVGSSVSRRRRNREANQNSGGR